MTRYSRLFDYCASGRAESRQPRFARSPGDRMLDVLHLSALEQECGLSLRSGAYPVPVMPVRDMPDLERVLNASYAAFDALQQGFQTTFVLG